MLLILNFVIIIIVTIIIIISYYCAVLHKLSLKTPTCTFVVHQFCLFTEKRSKETLFKDLIKTH